MNKSNVKIPRNTKRERMRNLAIRLTQGVEPEKSEENKKEEDKE